MHIFVKFFICGLMWLAVGTFGTALLIEVIGAPAEGSGALASVVGFLFALGLFRVM